MKVRQAYESRVADVVTGSVGPCIPQRGTVPRHTQVKACADKCCSGSRMTGLD